jgi:hypothetical protein
MDSVKVDESKQHIPIDEALKGKVVESFFMVQVGTVTVFTDKTVLVSIVTDYGAFTVALGDMTLLPKEEFNQEKAEAMALQALATILDYQAKRELAQEELAQTDTSKVVPLRKKDDLN